MTFFKSLGKQCKSRVMNLTEAEAGAFVVAGVTLNIVLILIWVLT